MLGQISAALELAEQIVNGDCDDPDAIYIAVGSSCTISGLVIGVVVARRLGLSAFQSKSFRIVGIPIHHVFAAAQRYANIHRSWLFSWLPMTIQHTVRSTCAMLERIAGRECGLEILRDLTAEAMQFVRSNELELRTDPYLIGTYGGHSNESKRYSHAYDRTGSVVNGKDEIMPHIWLCGHFTSKAFGCMVRDLDRCSVRQTKALFWQTKSALQPLSTHRNEWKAAKSMPERVRRWLNRGKSESSLRQGCINLREEDNIGPLAYRHLFTKVKL